MRIADEEHTRTHEPFEQKQNKKEKKGIFACTQLSNFPKIVDVVMALPSRKRFCFAPSLPLDSTKAGSSNWWVCMKHFNH